MIPKNIELIYATLFPLPPAMRLCEAIDKEMIGTLPSYDLLKWSKANHFPATTDQPIGAIIDAINSKRPKKFRVSKRLPDQIGPGGVILPQWEIQPITLGDLKHARDRRNAIKVRNEENVRKLADSIKQVGVLRPIMIRADGTIIDGFDRIEAAVIAGQASIPTIVLQSYEMLNALVEHAQANQMTDYGMTAEDFVKGLGEVHEGPWSTCPICNQPMNRKGHEGCKITDVYDVEGFTAHELANILLQMPDTMVTTDEDDVVRVLIEGDSIRLSIFEEF